MPNTISSAIANLSSTEPHSRIAATSEIYRQGRAPAERATAQWWQDMELSALLLAPKPIITVGLAVRRETFARIRDANGNPELAYVPPDQDTEEFELHFADGVLLDVLTTKDAAGQDAIARFLAKFGEGVQQVEFYCLNVDRATAILRQRFGVAPIYPASRPGAGGTKINFFLLPVPNASGENGKILIELYELPQTSSLTPDKNT